MELLIPVKAWRSTFVLLDEHRLSYSVDEEGCLLVAYPLWSRIVAYRKRLFEAGIRTHSTAGILHRIILQMTHSGISRSYLRENFGLRNFTLNLPAPYGPRLH